MPDIKQVLYDIERCTCHVPDACRDCSKYRGIDVLRCMEELMADAYTLLKEQEAEQPIVHENSYGWKFYYCPKCKQEFYQNRKQAYCDKCGKAVKWDEL